MNAAGRVTLVGAGPGAAGLITVKGLARLRTADVVMYDRLIGADLLNEANASAELIDVGKLPGSRRNSQESINHQLISAAEQEAAG